ncbi:hypothetical protein AGMMS50276_06860 [Synergistales bacterium]|nr:hypothetical protein AGMMS50276_06860 [Synergistales bacterium]
MSKRDDFHWIASKLVEFGLNDKAQKWKALESLLDIDLSTFRVVAAGQQNSGKSTLLNALCGMIDQEYFETGDRIVTRTTKEMTYQGIVYVDTPGLGTTDSNDDIESVRASKGACVILFVHSCVLGELNESECQRLKDLVRELDDPAKQIIVLCSKDTQLAENENLDDIVGKIRGQVDKITKVTKVIAIDSLDYIEGLKTSEPRLTEGSNFPQLISWIDEGRNTPNQAERNLDSVKSEILKVLRGRKAKLDKDCSLSREGERRKYLLDRLLAKWDLSLGAIETAWRRYIGVLNSLESLRGQL